MDFQEITATLVRSTTFVLVALGAVLCGPHQGHGQALPLAVVPKAAPTDPLLSKQWFFSNASSGMSSTPGPQRAYSGVLQPQSIGQAKVWSPGNSANQAAPGPRNVPRALHKSLPDIKASDVVPDTSAILGLPLPDPASVEAKHYNSRLEIFRNSTVPTPVGQSSLISEPSTDQSGKNIFATGNYHAEFSKDNGKTWQHLDPFTIFGGGFCCDQVTVYDRVHDRQHWILQYIPNFPAPSSDDHLTLAVSPGRDFLHWCPYEVQASILGWPEAKTLDYNDLVVGKRYLYLTTRIIDLFPPNGDYYVLAAVLMRISLDDLAACRPARFDVVIREDVPGRPKTESGEVRVTQGITDVAYAGAVVTNRGAGNNLRILVWPEESQVVTTIDREVPAFIPMGSQEPKAYPNCASEDGVVSNWCRSNDSALFATYAKSKEGGRLWFAWVAQQYGPKRPFPYSRITEIREADLRVASSRDLYGMTVAHVLPAIAADSEGRIGLIDSFGGGKGHMDYFPGGMLGILDHDNLTVDFFLAGKGNGCSSSVDYYQGNWGDYNTIRNWQSTEGIWIGTTYARADNDQVISCGNSGNVIIKNVVFGLKQSAPPLDPAQ